MEDVAATATREIALKFINSTSVATESDIRQGITVGQKVIAYHFGECLGFSILNGERAFGQIEDHVSVQVIADHVMGSWHLLDTHKLLDISLHLAWIDERNENEAIRNPWPPLNCLVECEIFHKKDLQISR